jgi:hypothetical protein
MLQQNISWLVHACIIIQTWRWPKWMGRNMLPIQWFNKLGQFGYSTAVFCYCSIPVYYEQTHLLSWTQWRCVTVSRWLMLTACKDYITLLRILFEVCKGHLETGCATNSHKPFSAEHRVLSWTLDSDWQIQCDSVSVQEKATQLVSSHSLFDIRGKFCLQEA